MFSHTAAAAVADKSAIGKQHKLELRNLVEYFKKHSKNKVNDLFDVLSSKIGQKKTKSTQKRKGKPQNQSSNTAPTLYISPVAPNPNSSI